MISMNQIVIFTLLFTSVVYVKLVNSQLLTSCQRAEQDLDNNVICLNASIAGNDSSLVCNGTCRTLYDAVIDVCGGTTALRITIYNLCDPCGIPLTALSSGDPSCSTYIFRRNATAICTGRCRSIIDDTIANCDNTSAVAMSSARALNDYCTPCGMAQTNLDLNSVCVVAYRARDADDVCTGTCRTLGDAIVANCNASISSTYASTINTLCGGGTNTGNCETAYGAVDVSCRDMLNSNSLVCTSSCGTALSAAATACISSTDPEIRAVISAYDQQCGSDAQCNAALQALEDETSCQSMDPSIVCSGMCSNLYLATINACPDVDADIAREAYNRLCGSGSMLKASGIITLLLAAMHTIF